MLTQQQIRDYADHIAEQLTSGQMPRPDQEFLYALESHPETVMDLLECVQQELIPQTLEGDDESEYLNNARLSAYLLLLSMQLEFIRYQVERGYPWAIELVADFQQAVADAVEEGTLPAPVLQQIILALREAKLEVDARLFALIEQNISDARQQLPSDELPALEDLLAPILQQCGDNPFEIVHLITEMTYAMPQEARLMLAQAMFSSEQALVRDAVPLMVLDDRIEIRQGIAQNIAQNPQYLSPLALRRLITLRNWLPPDERPVLDKAIQDARRKGVECAQWPEPAKPEIYASAPDGVGAQGSLMISKSARKFQLSSIVLKQGVGIADAWCDPRLHRKKDLKSQIEMSMEEAPIQPASREHLERLVQHYLALANELGNTPDIGLLAVAEALSESGWRPQSLDFSATVDELMRQLPKNLQGSEAYQDCLDSSDIWSNLSGLTSSWFEQDQAVSELLSNSRASRIETLSKQILNRIFEPRRQFWAENLVWMALWLREDLSTDEHLWAQFLIVADAVLQGRALKDIALFQLMAERTVLAYEDAENSLRF